MQYLLSVVDTGTGTATGDEMDAIDAFNDGLRQRGHWVFAGGLAEPASATIVDTRGDASLVTDGPFIESKEYVAGLWIIRADDLDRALELARAGSHACNRRVEVRPFLGD